MNAGTINLPGPITTNNATISVSSSSSALINSANGLDALATLTTNNGTITLAKALTTTTALTNTGTMSIRNTLQVASYTQTAGQTTIVSGKTLTTGAGCTGTLKFTGGTLTNVGTLCGVVTASAAVTGTIALPFSVTGSYTSTSTSATTVMTGLNGTTPVIGSITATGPVTLAGTLAVKEAPGYDPAIGTTFTVVSGSSVTGTFASVASPGLTGKQWVATYTATSVTLTMQAAYTIGGTINDTTGAPIAGVTVTRTGNGLPALAVTSAADGTYVIPNSVNGSYTITPTKTGLSFTPTPMSVAIANVNVAGKSFVGYAGNGIAGRVTAPNGSSVYAATITRSGGGQPTITAKSNTSGIYALPSTPDGTYTITVTATGYTGTVQGPQTVTITGATKGSIDFIVVNGPYIGGRITYNGQALSGTTLTLSAGPTTGSATSNSSGWYAFSAVTAGTYTVTPTLAGATFTPGSASVTVTATTSNGTTNFTKN